MPQERPAVFTGCIESGVCTAAPTCGVSPKGEKFTFPNGCVPEGWKSALGDPCCESSCTAADGTSVPYGGTYFDGCNDCYCLENGLVCTKKGCKGKSLLDFIEKINEGNGPADLSGVAIKKLDANGSAQLLPASLLLLFFLFLF